MNTDATARPVNDNTNTSFADAVERVAASVVGVVTPRGAASGVLWQSGVVVASAGALWRAQRLELVLPGGEPVAARLQGADAGTDLAALTFDAMPATPALARASAEPRVGDAVFAVGREPSGLVHASFGRVGAAGGAWRSWRGGAIDRLVRLDGGLFPGLAGAAVADAEGACIGIASPAFSRLHGVVLPPSTVDRVLAALLAHGRVRRGHLGIAAQPVRTTLDGAAVAGLLVSSVADDGPAAQGGVLVGDVIVAAGGRPVAQLEALRETLAAAVGQPLVLTLARGGARLELTLDVAERAGSHCG